MAADAAGFAICTAVDGAVGMVADGVVSTEGVFGVAVGEAAGEAAIGVAATGAAAVGAAVFGAAVVRAAVVGVAVDSKLVHDKAELGEAGNITEVISMAEGGVADDGVVADGAVVDGMVADGAMVEGVAVIAVAVDVAAVGNVVIVAVVDVVASLSWKTAKRTVARAAAACRASCARRRQALRGDISPTLQVHALSSILREKCRRSRLNQTVSTISLSYPVPSTGFPFGARP